MYQKWFFLKIDNSQQIDMVQLYMDPSLHKYLLMSNGIIVCRYCKRYHEPILKRKCIHSCKKYTYFHTTIFIMSDP